MENNQEVFAFRQCQLGDWERRLWTDLSWSVRTGEVWGVWGPNGSGKSLLCAALTGAVPVQAGQIELGLAAEAVQWIGFESQEDFILQERYFDDTDFLEAPDPGTLVEAFVGVAGVAWAVKLGLADRLDRGMKYLSTGELRKAFWARALGQPGGLLLLDEPYEGLDVAAREVVRQVLAELIGRRAAVVVFSQRWEDLPPGCTHLLRLEACRVVSAGPWSADLATGVVSPPAGPVELSPGEWARLLQPATARAVGQALVVMTAVRVAWGDQVILDQLDWTWRSGEHWTISGPNGCGKSTLLSLITGENQQVYRNQIQIFGQSRGQGLSLAELRRQVGFVSYALQLEHHSHLTANSLEVIISGFHDTIGLYNEPSWDQIGQARLWLKALGLADQAVVPFARQSFGVQRLLLLARAMVKQPAILILDEPCQGLDSHHRQQVLDWADRLGASGAVSLLYVTHHPEERLSCSRHRLEFRPRAEGGYRLEQRRLAEDET